jgi:hypothetical protein
MRVISLMMLGMFMLMGCNGSNTAYNYINTRFPGAKIYNNVDLSILEKDVYVVVTTNGSVYLVRYAILRGGYEPWAKSSHHIQEISK